MATILFSNNFEHKVHMVLGDLRGCYIIMDIELLKICFLMIIIIMDISGTPSQVSPRCLQKTLKSNGGGDGTTY